MPFCYSPWTNIDISPQGDITPCCKFQTKYYNQKFNIHTQTIKQYANSDFLNSIKAEFSQDQWPNGCERCRIEEENNIKSKRQLDYNRWKEHYQQYNTDNSTFITASVAFGNTCNLTCITCNSYSSSRWQLEYQRIFGVDIKPYHFYKDQFVIDFLEQAPHLVHLDIPGGEPFLSGIKEQKLLLEHYIQTGQSQDITLHYTTNATIFPDEDWWGLWEQFKEVDIQLSLDGIENKNEYIRYPSKWSDVIQHVKKYVSLQSKNIRLSISHTVSAFNILYLDDFFTWCTEQKLPTPWLGKVHQPIYMSPTVWPQNAKNFIISKLEKSQHADIKSWVTLMQNHDDSLHYDKFCYYVHKHDQYRGTNFNNTFEELSEFLKNEK